LEPSSSAGLKERKRERIGEKQPEKDLVKMGKTQKRKEELTRKKPASVSACSAWC
jgi:hypothetical protein